MIASTTQNNDRISTETLIRINVFFLMSALHHWHMHALNMFFGERARLIMIGLWIKQMPDNIGAVLFDIGDDFNSGIGVHQHPKTTIEVILMRVRGQTADVGWPDWDL